MKPINLEGLNSWVGKISPKILAEIDTLAPMLKKLGYDTKSKNPKYGEPDKEVLENMKNIKKNSRYYFNKAINVSDIFKMIYNIK